MFLFFGYFPFLSFNSGHFPEIDLFISAYPVANQFIMVFQICCMGIGMGASVLTSRFWGMKNQEALRKSITIMLRICLGFALLFSLVTFFAPEAIMRIYTTGPEIIREGARYFKWAVPCYLLLGLSLTSTIVLRSVGQVRLPLISSIFAFIINIFFNYLFIFGNFGAPRMGIEGSALSTLIARIVEFSVICVYLFFVDTKIRYRLHHFFMRCRGSAWRIGWFGLAFTRILDLCATEN